MVQPQIGIGNSDPNASTYDAIDLLDDGGTPTQSRTPISVADASRRYTIDSDDEEDSTEENSSSEEAEEEDLSYEESSEDDDSTENDDNDADEIDDVTSTAVTEVMSNILTHPPSPAANPGNNTSKSNAPPASSFRNISRRFPSYMLKGGRRSKGKDKKGRHQLLSTNDEDNVQDDEESNKEKVLMKNPVNKIRDPSQFPIEQYTDASYGSQKEFISYSYATSDPSNVQYEPQSLRRMEVKESVSLEEKQRRIIFWGLITAMLVCFIIAMVSIIIHVRRQHVQVPLGNLSKKCDISNISNDEGHLECEEACEEAKCCMAPGTLSCFKGQEDVCSLYAPCAALYSIIDDDDLHVMVPPAPSNLDSLCSFELVRSLSGYIECNSSCEAGSCCSPSSTENFLDFGLASSATGNFPKQPKSCASTHPDVCAVYEPCDNLKSLKDVHGTPVDLVNSKCTGNQMKKDQDMTDCENACQPRSCCFTDSKKRNCYDDNKVWCNQFSACKILTGEAIETQDEKEKYKSEPLVEKCKKDVRELSPSDLITCTTFCDPAACCFYEDAGCTRSIDCDFYDFCSSLMTSEFPSIGDIDNSLPIDEDIDEIIPPSGGQHSSKPSPSEVLEACNEVSPKDYSYKPYAKKTCSEMCDNFLCCFQDDYNPASCHDEDLCNKYTPCEKLIAKNDLCFADNLQDKNGYVLCEEHCRDHLCCFNSAGCNNDNSNCSDYESCKIFTEGVLVGTNIHGLTSFNYTQACSKENVLYGNKKAFCSSICEPYKCCWDDKLTCASHQKDCSQYEPCKILHEDGKTNLGAVCKKELVLSSDKYFVDECMDMCSESKCCFDESCKDDTTFCDSKKACSSVSLPDIACGDGSSSVNTKACDNACDIFSCCWSKSTDNNCYEGNKEKCSSHMSHCDK